MISKADRDQVLEELRQVFRGLAAAHEDTTNAALALDVPHVPRPYPREIYRAAAWVYNAQNVVSIVIQRFEEMEADPDA